MPNAAGERPGLQVERTLLSWERSALGFLVGGALILLKETGPFAIGRTALALVAGALTLMVLWLGYRRARRMRALRMTDGRFDVPPARVEVIAIGCGTAAFALMIAAVLLSTA